MILKADNLSQVKKVGPAVKSPGEANQPSFILASAPAAVNVLLLLTN
jgi:hypothetical protein